MDLKYIRENPEEVRRLLELRRCPAGIDSILALDAERRALAQERDGLRHEQKGISQAVAEAKRSGGDADAVMARARELSERVKAADAELASTEERLEELARHLPNVVHPSMTAEEEVIEEWGELPQFGFEPLAHWDLAEALDVVDFKAAAALSGSRFVVFRGAGARLERALINWFLDTHVRKNGYTELSMPVLARSQCLEGAGQLPHMAGEVYVMRDDELCLVPTSETTLANLHREQVLDAATLPRKYVTYSPCFRREAGSYGKDVRGMIRVHQFDKVELFRLTAPEQSYQALEEMLAEATALARELGLPYRVKRLAAWDIAYQAAKTYDIEAWSAGGKRWLEVSSVSNCEDYQTRRTDTRARGADGRLFHPHALNGSALALPRVFVAIIENFQQADGSVRIPEVLRPYLDGLERIS